MVNNLGLEVEEEEIEEVEEVEEEEQEEVGEMHSLFDFPSSMKIPQLQWKIFYSPSFRIFMDYKRRFGQW